MHGTNVQTEAIVWGSLVDIVILGWMNRNGGVAGWASGLGAFAAAGTAIWIARWQNGQRPTEAEQRHQRQAAERDAYQRLRKWMLAVSLKLALAYVKARAAGCRSGAIELANIGDKRAPAIFKQVDERAWVNLKIDLPQDLTENIGNLAIFGPQIGGGLGELVAYARRLNDWIESAKTFGKHPTPDQLITRADELLRIIDVVELGIRRIVQDGPVAR